MSNAGPGASRSAHKLVSLLRRPGLTQFVEAHNGLAARLAEQAGCEALWASSLTISTMMGVRDANEASWSQIVDVVEWMTQASGLPVLVDGDSGHGDFNNARRFGVKLAGRGAAGVCFEDKLFPKRNSFAGGAQDLQDTEAFSGMIAATKDACGSNLAVIARTESFICGAGIEEALTRAEAYSAAGADAIIVHSKRPDPSEVMEFARQWSGRAPLIAIPTTYPRVELCDFTDAGIDAIIWANHALRAGAAAMRRVYRTIAANGRPPLDDPSLAISEIFDMFEYGALDRDLDRYIPGAS